MPVSFVEPYALREHADLEAVAGTATAAPADVRSRREASFIDNLRSGDTVAFGHLVNERTPDIYALLLRLTEDVEEARDLTQETFLQAFRSIAGFRGDADLKTWLYRIAVNQARNRRRWWRRRRREATVSLDSTSDPEGELIGARLRDVTSADPEQLTLQHERERRLLKALSALSRDSREVVVLRDVEGLSYEEVATTLDVQIGTVKSRLSRARAELRRRLEDI